MSAELFGLTPRRIWRVVGLMSGTSVDAIDAAVVEIAPRRDGTGVRMRLLGEYAARHTTAMRARLIALAGGEPASAAEFAGLDARLGERFAAAALRVIAKAGLTPRDVHLIGSHGQTIAHAPHARGALAAPHTWQIGAPAVIAERTGIAVVSDFRSRDVAAGGEGAPLVPLVDYLLLGDARRGRAALNIGGIANVTLLPAGCAVDDVIAFDTGPGNAVLDELAQRATRGTARCDRRGRLAASGGAREDWVAELLRDPFFRRTPPRSTGRDHFGAALAERLWGERRARRASSADVLATATLLTARSIAHAVRIWWPEPHRLDEVVASGGGVHNPTLMRMLRTELGSVRVVSATERGVPADSKEAIAFALLAYRTARGEAGNVLGATGARHLAVLGSLTPGAARAPGASRTQRLPRRADAR